MGVIEIISLSVNLLVTIVIVLGTINQHKHLQEVKKVYSDQREHDQKIVEELKEISNQYKPKQEDAV